MTTSAAVSSPKKSESPQAVPFGRSAVAQAILGDRDDPLRRMDIFLTRNRTHILSRLISWSTKCYWSHGAVTFLVPHEEKGFLHAFVMESTGAGVDIQKADKYFAGTDHYDFAIVRLKAPWLSGVDEKCEEARKLARGLLLEHIDAQYDRSRFLSIAWDIFFRRPAHSMRLVRDRFRDPAQPPPAPWINPPNEYVCSGFVSYAFYEAARRLEQEGIGTNLVADALFHAALEKIDPASLDEAELARIVLSTSPGDLARSDKLDWKWIVLSGVPHKISSRGEAEELLKKTYG